MCQINAKCVKSISAKCVKRRNAKCVKLTRSAKCVKHINAKYDTFTRSVKCENVLRYLFTFLGPQTSDKLVTSEGRKDGRKELVLFDINKHNTEYTLVKLCRETPTKAQPVPLSREPPTCRNTKYSM